MNKKINIYAPFPVKSLRPTVQGNIKGVYMSEGDIYKLLCGKAQVFEIIDNTTVQLTFSNYNKNNSITNIDKHTVIEDKPVEDVIKTEEVQNTETPVELENMPEAQDPPEVIEEDAIPDTELLVEDIVEKDATSDPESVSDEVIVDTDVEKQTHHTTKKNKKR